MSATAVVKAIRGLRADLAKMAKDAAKVIVDATADEGVALVQLGFDQGVAPDGKPWKPPKHRPGGRPLRDNDILMGSVTDDSALRKTADGFELGTNVIYAGVHQHGWEEKNIVARPFLPDPDDMPPEWEEALDEAATEAVDRLLK